MRWDLLSKVFFAIFLDSPIFSMPKKIVLKEVIIISKNLSSTFGRKKINFHF